MRLVTGGRGYALDAILLFEVEEHTRSDSSYAENDENNDECDICALLDGGFVAVDRSFLRNITKNITFKCFPRPQAKISFSQSRRASLPSLLL